MRIARGRRPWTIHAFAAAFLAVGLWDLVYSLTKLHRFRIEMFGTLLNEDGLIVYHSAMFTIICIPVIAVWLFGSRIARGLITVMTLWGAGMFTFHFFSGPWMRAILGMSTADRWDVIGTRIVCLLAIALLFLPASRPWFRKEQSVDVSAFA